MMLCDFTFQDAYQQISNINDTFSLNQTANSSSLIIKSDKLISKPTWIQFLIISWVFTFFCEEIRQVKLFDIFRLLYFKNFIFL